MVSQSLVCQVEGERTEDAGQGPSTQLRRSLGQERPQGPISPLRSASDSGLLCPDFQRWFWSWVLGTIPGPGISFYAHNPAKAGESLRDCLDQALTHIPKDKWQGTPLFLGATAGMRLLR